MSTPTYWIGDDGDFKSVAIDGKVYQRGDKIPVGNVPETVLDKWRKKGVISGEKAAPIVIKDAAAIKALEVELERLKVTAARVPGLEKYLANVAAERDKAQSGKKAARLKALELDNQEKLALIEKLLAENAELKATKAPEENEGGDSPGFGG